MKQFKVKAINLYGSLNSNKDIVGFEEWEDILQAETKEELLKMLSNNNQVLNIEELEEDFNTEKFNLQNNIEIINQIKNLVDKLGTLDSHLDDSGFWYKNIPLRDILFNLTLHYTTYKNKIDFEFPLYGTNFEEVRKKINKVI